MIPEDQIFIEIDSWTLVRLQLVVEYFFLLINYRDVNPQGLLENISIY
jgi:hypothetical protein